MNVLIEIGADVNFGEGGETPLCIAVKAKNKKMVESLLEHDIANVNVREALKLSWELKLDAIVGVLLEHIAVDRSRDSANLSGLELTTLKPLWILPSLGVKTLPEPLHYRHHRRQQSLGHVKDFLIRRKSVACTESPFVSEMDASLVQSSKKDSRRKSVDLSSLKYGSEVGLGDEEVDFVKQSKSIGHGPTPMSTPLLSVSGLSPIAASPQKPHTSLSVFNYGEDSGVDSSVTVQPPDLSDASLGNKFGTFRDTFRRQRNATISGASTLPHSTLAQYTRDKKEEESLNEGSSVHTSADTLSPAQLFKKLRNHKKIDKHLTDSLSFSASGDSPIPVMYYPYQQEDGCPTPLSPCSPRSEGTMSPPNSSTSLLQISPMSGSGGSPMRGSPMSSGGDEVDYGGFKSIPEESSLTANQSTHLIKMLDLSSNQLCNFNDLCSSSVYGGEFVFKQMKEVASLDLKQNRLSELMEPMMKVK